MMMMMVVAVVLRIDSSMDPVLPPKEQQHCIVVVVVPSPLFFVFVDAHFVVHLNFDEIVDSFVGRVSEGTWMVGRWRIGELSSCADVHGQCQGVGLVMDRFQQLRTCRSVQGCYPMAEERTPLHEQMQELEEAGDHSRR